jgi:ribonuclease VapC
VILDSSAVVAVLRAEPEADAFRRSIESSDAVAISAATLVELSLVVGPDRQAVLDRFLAVAGAVVEPVDAEQASIARRAAIRFGRGSGSPARLNFGDCFAYALASATGRPLLCKGDDFVHTDLELVH